jgi:hypothetical protein
MASSYLPLSFRAFLVIALSAQTVGGCTEPGSDPDDPFEEAYYGDIPVAVEVADGLEAARVRVGLFTAVTEGELELPGPDAQSEAKDIRVRVSQPDGGRVRVWVLDDAGQPDEMVEEGVASIAPEIPVEGSIDALEVDLPPMDEAAGGQTYALIAWYDDDMDGALDLGIGEDGEAARAFACTHDDRNLTLTHVELSNMIYGEESTERLWRVWSMDASMQLVSDDWPETWVARLDAATEPPLD